MSEVALDRAKLLTLVEEARRAPSVHNIQPARWALDGPEAIQLLAHPDRTLPIADPTGHDVRLSLGAACEGMAMALTRHGYELGDVRLGDGPGPVARLSVAPGGRPDPLAEHVSRRAAYRGTFAAADPARFLDLLTPLEGHYITVSRDWIRELAKLANEAAAEFLLDRRYWRETWGWVRLSRSDPRWDRDGLNADTMALSGMERALGRWLMAPPAFEVMRKLGLAGALLSERTKIESAGALVLFTAPVGEDPFVTGRAFYRAWLQVTAAGLALCPISALADSKRANAEIRRRIAMSAGQRLVNVFRVGATPAGFSMRLTPRLPAADLVTAS